ncbi:hypothetical protein DFJ74DRAFT_681522 [Hyaloraphidium curvatum]|nr:hypothetical protein DFJ74DRAFT_681522 [Hyaloraphidium curvatum]
MEKFYPSYEMYIEEPDDTRTFVLAARKRKKSKSSNYIITTSRITSAKRKEDVVAKVRSNFVGTVFTIYDNGRSPAKPAKPGAEDDRPLRQELATVLYEPNILGFKGPRKMTVLMPSMTKTGERIAFAPADEKDGLYQRYKTSRDREILTLHNKSPQWNEETQSYVLNFNGRVTLASVKNFQIVHDNDLDYILLQFGRIPEDSFTLDFQYPMSAVTAFGIALTSFDAKLACE